MSELTPTPFPILVERLHAEPRINDALFELPSSKWFRPDPLGPDLSVRFHGTNAANPCGPAAGPHTQMAQNLVLSYLAGGRIMELKTIQVNDRLTIPRPCIDMTNVGYNVEWSQELRINQSISEYVSGMMLVHMVRQGQFFGDLDLTGPLGDVIYDISLGYDLAGIQSKPVRHFIEAMLDCTKDVDSLKAQLPPKYAHLADLDYPGRISNSITLSTFHGCPADEIESICRFLIDEYDLNVVVKMNPPMLGKERLNHLLYDVLGYTGITVRPEAFTSGLAFDDGIALCQRLTSHAAAKGLELGAKFSNTLEVLNHRDFFPDDCKEMYLSGLPLYAITMTLVEEFRKTIGDDFPISFSAGIDAKNFPAAVACGMVPVTMCSDLLKPGGYARLPKYLEALTEQMKALNAKNLDDYILKVAADSGYSPTGIAEASLLNTLTEAKQAREEVRYKEAKNRAVPKRIDSHLVVFDCITCDKCLPVCPNAANFIYHLEPQTIQFCDYLISNDGSISARDEVRQLTIDKKHQIANFADYCNECGNCDTFCPEYGGPFIEKPSFFASRESFDLQADQDGFFIQARVGSEIIEARYRGQRYTLKNRDDGTVQFCDHAVQVEFDSTHRPTQATMVEDFDEPHLLDLSVYHTLRMILRSILSPERINPVNVSVPANK